MAVFRNYYTRYNHLRKLSLAVSCLYLLCSTINCTIVNGERIRHRHNLKPGYDGYQPQVEKTSAENSPKIPVLSCPNCLYKTQDAELKSETDNLRLEAIKRQILSKLGLKHKPNVTHTLPREIIMDTLFRAEDSDGLKYAKNEEDVSTTSARTSNLETVDVDDFYGRTSEIISFAEQGKNILFLTQTQNILSLPRERK